MKLPQPVIIPDEKLIEYLLVYRERNDKSKFLAQAGFTQSNPEQLKNSILEPVAICYFETQKGETQQCLNSISRFH